jgi:hypothetical protein
MERSSKVSRDWENKGVGKDLALVVDVGSVGFGWKFVGMLRSQTSVIRSPPVRRTIMGTH